MSFPLLTVSLTMSLLALGRGREVVPRDSSMADGARKDGLLPQKAQAVYTWDTCHISRGPAAKPWGRLAWSRGHSDRQL